jgi:hypothetical protein
MGRKKAEATFSSYSGDLVNRTNDFWMDVDFEFRTFLVGVRRFQLRRRPEASFPRPPIRQNARGMLGP